MRSIKYFALFIFLLSSVSFKTPSASFAAYIVAPQSEQLRLHWKVANGEKYRTVHKLRSALESSGGKVQFIMNCGMYTPENDPVGLYIEGGKKYSSIKRCNNSRANFCLQPQGVFYITKDRRAGISTVDAFRSSGVAYAVEAAPMVVVNGKLNTAIPVGKSIVRNGAGIRKDGKVVLAISRGGVTFRELGEFFLAQGCTTAIYFDGGVSKAILSDGTQVPETRYSLGGLGAMLSVTR